MLKYLFYRKSLRRSYEDQFKIHGTTPEGCCWSDRDRQNARFNVIFDEAHRILPKKYTVADIGCGYGAMLDYVLSTKSIDLGSYTGYDISRKLVDSCKKRFEPTVGKFCVGEFPIVSVDFAFMSGTYNLTATRNVYHWEEYVWYCLAKIWESTLQAMIFNLQSSGLDRAYISKNNIYYANVDQVVKKASCLFGTTVSIQDSILPKDITFVVKRK